MNPLSPVKFKALLDKIISRELGTGIVSYDSLTLGWSGSHVYSVITDKKKVIVKISTSGKEPSFEDEPVQNRVYGSRFSNLSPVYQLLKDKHISVPTLFAVGREGDYFYAVMDFLEGTTKVPETIVAEELGKIHQITRDYFGWVEMTLQTNWKEDFFGAYAIQVKSAAEVSAFIQKNKQRIEKFIDDYKIKWIEPKEFVLSHTDGFQGMAKEEHGQTVFTGVIDLEDHMFTDQRFVLSGCELLSEWWMKKKVAGDFWRNYTEHKTVDSTYQSFKDLFQLFYILAWIPGYYNMQGDETKRQKIIEEAEQRVLNYIR